MNIYVFGNPVEESDSLPAKLLPRLQKEFPRINFIHADPTENWWRGEKDIIIVDAVKGIEKVTLFDTLDTFQKQTLITPHDYDLLTDLLLLKKLGKIARVTIIGIPQTGDKKEVFGQTSAIIARIHAGNNASNGAGFLYGYRVVRTI